MSNVACMALQHNAEPSESLIRRVLHDCGSPLLINRREVTNEDREHWIRVLRENDFKSNIPGFDFQRPIDVGGKKIPRSTSLLVAPYQGVWNLQTNNTVRIEPFLRSPRDWLLIKAGPSGFDATLPWDAEWFFERVRPFIPIFTPRFGFADTQESLIERIGDDPRTVVWPVMIFGPEIVAEKGRDVLLKAPAWRVEELPYGGIWIQAAENALEPSRLELRELGSYLGLTVPR